jgi:hypothetical protein
MANPKIIFTGVDQASVVTQKIAGGIDKLKLALSGIASAAVVGVFRNVVNDLDALEEAASSAGIAVETLGALRYAAQQGGVGAEALDEALKRLNLQLAAAAEGGKEAQALFKSIGINAVNSSGQILGADEALSRIADKFASFRDGPAKAALAVDLFGKAGTRLIPLLNQGAAGLEALKAEAERLGVVFGSELVGEASKFNDQLDRLQASSRAAAVGLFGPLITGANRLVEEWQAASRAGADFAAQLAFTSRYFNLTADEASAAIADTNEQIRERQRIIDAGTYLFIDPDRIREEIGGLQIEKKALQEVLALRRVLETDARSIPDPNLNRFRPSGAAPARGNASQQISEGQRLIANLQNELARTRELTEVQELQAAIAERRIRFDTQAQQARALAIAQAIDDERAFLAAVKASEEAVKSENVERQRQAASRRDRLADLTGQSAIKRLAEDVKLLDDAFFENRITVEQYQVALTRVFGVNSDVAKGMQEQTDLAERLGLTISSSLGELITTGGKASDIFRALGQDILKLTLQLTVLEPLAGRIKDIFKSTPGSGSSGGGLLGFFSQLFGSFGSQNLVGVFDKGTDYVPRTGLAIVHQGEQIIPAGRSGGGVVINQVVNVDSRSDIASVRQAMAIAKRQAQTEILESIRRRGVFARAG